jgi:enoyl-CoA hydratase/carnithine racemase
MSALIDIEDRNSVRHIALNRPQKRNALDQDLVTQIGQAFSQAGEADSVRCVVLKGFGPMFSAGMDLASLRALADDPTRLRGHRSHLLAVYNAVEALTKPTICQIHGGCLGGAMELALCCDFRVMAKDAVCGLLETRVGLVPDLGGTSRLPAVVGLGRAKELVMCGRVIDGDEAHRIGFANRIAPSDELDAATESLCEELLACAPLAVSLAKRVMDSSARPTLSSNLELEVQAQELLARSEDFAEGAEAALAKRTPNFAGR